MPDPIRDQLAEVLRRLLASDDATMYYDAPHAVWGAGDRYADALLPLVESCAAQQAAKALREAAEVQQAEANRLGSDPWGSEAVGRAQAAEDLRARAAALDPNGDPR